MPMSPQRWHAISKSQFAWEQEALEFIRARLPDCDPYLAWANFEFVADDGSINEVDTLVVTKMGVFLVEIKSWPGEVSGDAGLWTWTHEGRKSSYDNPLLLTNRKAKKLKSLLQHQGAFKGKQCPWIEPLVFLSAPGVQSRLTGNAAQKVSFRDPEKGTAPAARPGIVRAMTHRECPGLQAGAHFEMDRPMAQAFASALQQAGIRESCASRRVGDYELEALLFESPTGVYQDWLAKHAKQGSKRLVRIYLTARQASAEDREIVARAADREYRLMEPLDHPSILHVEDSTESELGPALRFRYPADAVRLDLFIGQEGERLNATVRVALLRLIAEAVQYAHGKRTFHRALSPQSILVRRDGHGFHVLLHNWISRSRFEQFVAGQRCDLERFFALLTKLEDEVTRPEEPSVTTSPLEAKAGDRLPGGYEVVQRLGSGSNSLVFLVRKGDAELVLKLATKPEHNERIGREFQTIKKLEHPQIIRAHEQVEMGGLAGFTMDRAGSETLAQRLRKEGPLSIDFLERFGEDLLDLVKFLEDKGVPHRDLKPDNLGVGEVISKRRLRLLLFDFSLSHSSPENLHVGTRDYLDPFLKQRPSKRWDIHAERYAAAMTLHQMATSLLPKWGDGQTAPEFTKGEIGLAPERFDPSLRDGMIAFFRKALARDFRERFDTIDEMRRAWTKAFSHIDAPKAESSHGEIDRAEVLKSATPAMQLVLFGLSARASNAVDRINVHTVRDFLQYPLRRLYRMRGVGHATSGELVKLYRELRTRFPEEEGALAGTLRAVESDDKSAKVPALCDYAKALGKVADALAAEDPIPTPSGRGPGIVTARRASSERDGIAPLSDNRLLQFAAAVSEKAAVSSSLEIYPRGLDPLRALRCARHSLFAAGDLRLDDIQSRVRARYPEAAPLPPRPKIDELIRNENQLRARSGFDGVGATRCVDGQRVARRAGVALRFLVPEQIGTNLTDEPKARLLDRRLRRAEKEGAFLALTTPRKHYVEAEAALLSRFKLERCDLDAIFLTAMRDEAGKRGVQWDLVLKADAAKPDSADWRKLMILLDHCLPAVEAELVRPHDSTRLLIHAGLLARYGRIPLLSRVSQRIGHAGGPHGLWLLLPADGQSPRPMIEGEAVPVITTNEHAELTEDWLCQTRATYAE